MEAIFQFIWYLIIGVSVVLYTVLDGFDLGVGCLHLCAKGDTQRRLILNAIGPVWDWMFSIGSYVIAFTIGLILGNLIIGIPIDRQGEFLGSFLGFFTPYTILVGLMGIAVFVMHGAIYMLMKTEGEMHERVHRWVNPSIIIFIVLYLVTTFATLVYKSHMIGLMKRFSYVFGVGILTLLAIVCIPYFVRRKKEGKAFICSCLSITFLIALFGLGTYPFMVRSSINDGIHSLTLYNSGAAIETMKVILVVALIGVPLVFAYGYWIYRIFRGKVKLDKESY